MSTKPVVRPIFAALVIAVDLVVLCAVGTAIIADTGSLNYEDPWASAVGVTGLSVMACLVMANGQAYRFDRLADIVFQIRAVVVALSIVAFGFLVFVFLARVNNPDHGRLAIAGLAGATLALAVVRAVVAGRIADLRRAGRAQTAIALVGANATAVELSKYINEQHRSEYRILGIFDDRAPRPGELPEGTTIAGTLDDLKALGRSRVIDQIILTLPPSGEKRVLELLDRVKDIAAGVHMAPGASELHFMFRRISRLGAFPIYHVFERPMSDRDIVIKRIEDLVIGSLALAALAPVLALIALVISLTSPGPILFRQRRYGLNNQSFDIYKFRTMTHNAPDMNGALQAYAGDPRITRVGAVLRRWSLDELPQLLNVLIGDMSLVGPRPHPLMLKAGDQQYETVVRDYAARHRMKPGMTGWAQINGWRGDTSSVEHAHKRIEFDLYYIANWSVAFDLQILALTLPAVIAGRNAV